MPVLATTPNALVSLLENMSPSEVAAQHDFVAAHLNHRSPLVRWAAALALGKSRGSEEALRARLAIERNELVITEICESLSVVGGQKSSEDLKDLAIRHRSPLVRSYAVMAVGDILHKEAISFLTDRLSSDPSLRVKATLRVLLLSLGVDNVLVGIQKDLCSRNQVIRRLVANLLAHYRPRRKRREILAALQAVLQVEVDRGAAGDFQHAIEAFTKR